MCIVSHCCGYNLVLEKKPKKTECARTKNHSLSLCSFLSVWFVVRFGFQVCFFLIYIYFLFLYDSSREEGVN
jgi:hypothetical protein